jgi:branched-chain amino acid transport system ATP-binding protein
MNASAPLLSVAGLVVRYGAITAVRGVDIEVDEGEAVAIVGPNGAGKSSLLAAIAGVVRPAAGSVAFAGRRLDRVPLEAVVRAGVALVPEGRRIFASLTVAENPGLAPRRAPTATACAPIASASSQRSRSSANGGCNRPANCRAANSSSWRSRGRLSRGRGC